MACAAGVALASEYGAEAVAMDAWLGTEIAVGTTLGAEALGAGSLAAEWAALDGTSTLVMGGELAAGGAGAFADAAGFAGLGAEGAAAAEYAKAGVMPEGFGMTPEGSVAAMDTLGSTNFFESALGTAANGGLGLGDIKGALQIASPLMSIGSGLYGMSQADQMRKLAAMSGKRADPWGASGGRSVADAQLQELMGNPSQVASRDPSYALRMQGAQRANAIYGQDSGAMAVAGANASTNWYNERLGQLGGLAGANASPASGEQISMTGQVGANDLASRSLASIGYGVTRGGGGTGMELPPGFREQLRAAGYAV